MVQYRLKKEKDFKNLQTAINNYTPSYFLARPFSLGNETKYILKNLKNKTFTFETKNGLSFLINKKEILSLPLKDYHKGFSLEYHNSNGFQTWQEYYHPMDPGLPMPKESMLRSVLDDLLIEISFTGKIKLKEDGYFGTHMTEHYWKII
jgi:hypothetical protein